MSTTTTTAPRPLMTLRGDDLEDARAILQWATLDCADRVASDLECPPGRNEQPASIELLPLVLLRQFMGEPQAPVEEDWYASGAVYLDTAQALERAARAVIERAEHNIEGHRSPNPEPHPYEAAYVSFMEEKIDRARRLLSLIGARA